MPACNQTQGIELPEMPSGYRSIIDKEDGWTKLKRPELGDMKTWKERLGHRQLRLFTDKDGHFWLEQNPAKASK